MIVQIPEDTETLYERLFRSAYPKLLVYARGIVGDDDEAEDVVEDVFVELWKRRGSVSFGDKMEAYLYRAVFTRCINALRGHNAGEGRLRLLSEINERRMENLRPDHRDASTEMENSDLGRAIDEAVGELPEKCRMVFSMSYLNDMHNEEIARTMGLSVRTVEHHIYRALRFLREKLGGRELCLFFSVLCTELSRLAGWLESLS